MSTSNHHRASACLVLATCLAACGGGGSGASGPASIAGTIDFQPAGTTAPLTAGTGTIGVRVSSHPIATWLVAGLGGPVTAPSANPPGAAPPWRLDEARAYFGERVAVYVDGGELPGGASTVAAVDGDRVRVLRAGPVGEASLRAALEGG